MNRRMLAAMLAGVVAVTSVAACGTTAGTATMAGAAATSSGSSSGSSPRTSTAPSAASGTLFDSSSVHSISVTYDQAAYDAMIATYQSSGQKEWISATVTIDGAVFENVGIKLKGNSSLGGLGGAGGPGGPRDQADTGADSTSDAPPTAAPETSADTPDSTTTQSPDSTASEQPSDAQAQDGRVMNGAGGGVSADEPEGLPWRIKLDKFVEGQNYQGETDIVVRGNNSETSLNEAVALELIGAAGMPTEEASPIRFSVNGSSEQLRLVVENPGDDWYSENVGVTGILYKAEAGGDYSYRGDDPTAYEDVFDVEANTTDSTTDEYAPLIAFLRWLNESDDATFAAELAQHVDIQSFADYLAVQDLVQNFDDIDGPGNNSYLSYDESTGLFTVISWDQNLSFGGMGGGTRGGPGEMTFVAPDGAAPTDGQLPPRMQRQDAGSGTTDGAPNIMRAPAGGGAGPSAGNVLSQKFLANSDFAAMVDRAKTDLKVELYESGTAQQILDAWTAVLKAQATDLVPAETIDSEASRISDIISA